MTVKSASIIETLAGTKTRPRVTYRYAGDRYVLVEYGDMELSLFYNLRAMGLSEQLRTVSGVIESVPSFRALLVHYDAAQVSLRALLESLKKAEEQIPSVEDLVIPSRVIELPMSFRDRWTTEYIAWYTKNIRADAPNVMSGHNIDYVAQYNGLDSTDELIKRIIDSQWWTAMLGFWPGLPFFMPVDPRCMVTAPKYNPTRPRTPEATVGIGGPCVAIYPIESPGGYQLLGRTIPIFDIQQRNPAFHKNPVLFQPADRVKFMRVTDDQLEELRNRVVDGTYRYNITSYELFDVKRYVAWTNELQAEAAEFMRRQEEARRTVPVP